MSSYTMSFISYAVHNFIPYGDCIPGMERKEPVINKKQEKARLATAKRMKQAVKEKKLDPSFANAASRMEYRAKKNLSERNYSKKQYPIDQLAKAAPLLDVVVPGVGITMTTLSQAGSAYNVSQYANESPSTQDTILKTAKLVAPIMVTLTSPWWMPLIAPYMTASVIGGTAAVLGTALTLDAIQYLRA